MFYFPIPRFFLPMSRFSSQYPQTASILHKQSLRTQASNISTTPIIPPPPISTIRRVILHHNGNHCPLVTCHLTIENYSRDSPPPPNNYIIQFFQRQTLTLPLVHDPPGVRVTHCNCKRRRKLGHGSEAIFDNQQWTCKEYFGSDVEILHHSNGYDSLNVPLLVTNAAQDESMIWLVGLQEHTITWKAFLCFGFKPILRRIRLWTITTDN